MMNRSGHQQGRFDASLCLVAVLCLLALTACAPTFDWRELRLPGLPMTFMLPAKPSQMTREVTLAEHKLPMSMAGAERGGLIFTAAWVDLRQAGSAPPSHERVLDAMIAGMLANIGARDFREEAVDVPVRDTADNSRTVVSGRRVVATGEHAGNPISMLAVFVALPTQAHQFVIMGERIDEEAAEPFIDSVVLMRLPSRTGA